MAVVEQSQRGNLGGLWSEFVAQSVTEHPADSRTEHALPTTVVLITVAAALTGLHFTRPAPSWWSDSLNIGDPQLTGLVWWGAMSLLWYVVPGLLVIRYLLRRPLSDFGLAPGGALAHWRVYVGFLAIMIPLVIAVSYTDHFQAIYPFYRPALTAGVTPLLFGWWLVYAIQFLSLEFFFRGFLLHGLRPHLGFASIGVMIVPYTMIHFSKPPLEATAAILAGLALGALSLRTRSIWLGAWLHISVAAAMDLAALWHAGVL